MLDNVNIWRNLGAAAIPGGFLFVFLALAGIEPLMAVRGALWLVFIGWLFACIIDFFYVGSGSDIVDRYTGGDDESQPYELDIEIFDGAKWRRIQTHLDEWQIYRLMQVMAEEDHSVYAETRKEWGTKAFTRWDLSRVLPTLEREGIAHQVGGRREWRLTDYGLRIWQRMEAPPDKERRGSLKVRI